MVNKRSNGLIISSFTYSYDNVGNRLSMATQEGTHSYTYDDNYQLTNVTYPDSSTITYNYDELGNRITVTEGGATDTYASNNLNQYTQINSTTLSYDLNGSLTGDGSWAYSYDYEGRMVSTEKIGSSVSYSYDDFGRRIKKDVGGTITKYLYDGSQCVLEKDSPGVTQARYVYGSRIDEPIIMIRDGNTYYYHFDGLGNVVDITNSLGVIVESYTYDVFGKVSVENPHVNPPIPNPNPHIPPRNPRIPSPPQSTGNPYFFTGRRLDTETGLYYYRARYYDPGMGRFLTTDPVGYREGMNLYTYCKNNPVKYVDPYGLGAGGDGGSGGDDGNTPEDEIPPKWWEWFKKWVPKGPESVHARWILLENDPNFVSLVTGQEPVITWRSDQWLEQYGHYEYFGGRIEGESYTRRYGLTHPKTRNVDPGFTFVHSEPAEKPYERIPGDTRRHVREKPMGQWDRGRAL